MMTEDDAMASNVVVAVNIFITSRYAYALFDPSAMHSFVSTEFVKKLDVLLEPPECGLCVDTPIDDFLIANCVFKLKCL